MAHLRSLILKSVLICASITVTLGACEVLARIFIHLPIPSYFQGMFIADDEIGYRTAPNASGLVRSPEYTTLFESNSQGWRGKKEYELAHPPAGRIIFVGDSFVQAVQVDEASTAVALIRQKWSSAAREEINAGLISAGPQEELKMVRRLMPYHPSMIAWVIFIGNDYYDAKRPLYSVSDGFITSTPVQTHYSLWDRLLMKIKYHTQLAKIFLYAIQYSPRLTLLDKIPVVSRLRWQEQMDDTVADLYRPDKFSALSKIWDEKVSTLLADAQREAGTVPIVAVIAPEKRQVDDNVWLQTTNAYPDLKDENRYLDIDWMKDWLAKHGLKTLDLTPALIDATKEAPAYFFQDPHWNALGNKVAADQIAVFLDSVRN